MVSSALKIDVLATIVLLAVVNVKENFPPFENFLQKSAQKKETLNGSLRFLVFESHLKRVRRLTCQRTAKIRHNKNLTLTENDASAFHIVRADLNGHPVAWDNTNSKFPHFPGKTTKNHVIHVIQLDTKSAPNLFKHGPGQLNRLFFCFLLINI